MNRFSLMVGFACTLAAQTSHGATLIWPNLGTSGPCRATLSECINIDASRGDEILIGNDEATAADGYTEIDEDVSIGKGIQLRPAPGIDAVVLPGHQIDIAIAGNAPEALVLQGLQLIDSPVRIANDQAATGTRSYAFSQLRMRYGLPGEAIRYVSGNASVGSVSLRVEDSVFIINTSAASVRADAVAISGSTANVRATQIQILRNKIVNQRGLGKGISISELTANQVLVNGNQIVGRGFDHGVHVSVQATVSATVDIWNNAVSGQQSSVPRFAIDVAGSNLVARLYNNTLVDNHYALQVSRIGDAGSFAGSGVYNNIVAHSYAVGISIQPQIGAQVLNSHNLIYLNASNAFSQGPSTLLSDPQLESFVYPKPLASSPVIDQGSNSVVSGGANLLDADGDQRQANGTVDLGAYERRNDLVGKQTSSMANILAPNAMRIDGLAGLTFMETLLVTPHRPSMGGAAEMSQALGIRLESDFTWSLRNQNIMQAFSAGRDFSVIAPATHGRFIHRSQPSNIVGDQTRLDYPEFNGNASAKIFAIARVDNDMRYHNHPVSLVYDGTAGRWSIRNEDAATMDADRYFNIVDPYRPSPNAFRAAVGAEAAAQAIIAHPLLDENLCALPFVARLDDPSTAGAVRNPAGFSLGFRAASGANAARHWAIVAEGAGSPSFPAGAAFNLLIDGSQANRCLAATYDLPLFSDEFE